MAGSFTDKESRLVKAALENVQVGDGALMKLVRTSFYPAVDIVASDCGLDRLRTGLWTMRIQERSKCQGDVPSFDDQA